MTRKTYLERACEGSWEGTHALLKAIFLESRYNFAWRPARAAAMMAVATVNAPENHVWMTPAEFVEWQVNAMWCAKKRKIRIKTADILDTTPKTLLSMGRGETPIPKMTALACAHYALGLQLPIPENNPLVFGEWFNDRFGTTSYTSTALDCTPLYISQRIHGFAQIGEKRSPRLPSGKFIRALDWIDRMGPICPYGAELDVRVFPDQIAREVAVTC